jgi:L-amino acid N-acyltransferase YncA
MSITIRLFEAHDWKAVSAIYELGLLTKNASFETRVPDYDSWIKKFHSHLLWVAVDNAQAVGWAGLQPVSARKVYEGVAEVSIYIHQESAGRGIGSMIMKHLIEESEKAGIWTLHASIFPENETSIRLHLRHGFREVGYREKVGQLEGKWRNTVFFERRSKKVGL